MSTVGELANPGPAIRASRRRDRDAFRLVARLAGLSTLALLGAIVVFLAVRAAPALHADTANVFSETGWSPDATPPVFGFAALAFGTAASSLLALVIAVPLAIGTALFAVEYAPARFSRPLGYVSDLLAVIPSVVYGLWGLLFLVPHLVGVQSLLARWLGWIPLFADPGGHTAQVSYSIFAVSVVLAIMILPIIAALTREVLRNVDPAHREAALALGATRWEMIRLAVLPPSWPGIVGAIMLGLGRALGETIAVALVIGATFRINWHVLQPGGNTIAANIANTFGEAGAVGRSALIASGLVLFVMTFAVNGVARLVLGRAARRHEASR